MTGHGFMESKPRIWAWLKTGAPKIPIEAFAHLDLDALPPMQRELLAELREPGPSVLLVTASCEPCERREFTAQALHEVSLFGIHVVQVRAAAPLREIRQKLAAAGVTCTDCALKEGRPHVVFTAIEREQLSRIDLEIDGGDA